MDGVTLDISIQRAGQWQPSGKEFVRATGQVSCAEPPPDPNDYPGALPHTLHAGPPGFTPPDHPVDLKNASEGWRFSQRRCRRYRPAARHADRGRHVHGSRRLSLCHARLRQIMSNRAIEGEAN